MPNDDLSRHKSKLRLNLKSTTFYLHAPTHNSNKEIKLASDSVPFSFHRNYICQLRLSAASKPQKNNNVHLLVHTLVSKQNMNSQVVKLYLSLLSFSFFIS